MAARVNSLSKTFVWILMGLLILGLAGFGAVNLTGTVRTVATVGDEYISVDAYVRELRNEIRAVEAQTGQPMQMSQVREIGLDRRALSRLVALAALNNETGQLGVSIGDENLQREIVQIPAFQGANGAFDRDGYRFVLEQAGLSESEFESDLRKESARTLVQGAVVSGVEMPGTAADTLADFVGARRSFTVATLSADKLETVVAAPTDAEIEAYYGDNQQQFTLPRTKRMTYALLAPDMLLDQLEIDEDAVRRLYEQRESEFNQPERRLVERLVFPDETSATDAKAQIEIGGTTFEALVRDRGLSLSDVDLGDLAADDLDEAADAVFGAEIGETVGPVASDFGPALFRVNGILEARQTSFEDVADELRDELAAEQARRLIESRAEPANDLLAGGATLEELAQETDMELGRMDWTADTSEGIAAYDGFRQAAQAVRESDFPEIGFLEDGSIFALRLDEELEPRPEPLETARDRVADAWTAAATQEALAAEAGALVSELAVEGDFTAFGLPVRVENGLTRTAFLDYAPFALMEAVFDMDPGELRVVPGEEAVHILRLDEELPRAETDEMTAMRDALGEQLNQALAQNIFDAFVRDAQSRAAPRLDQQALNAVQAGLN